MVPFALALPAVVGYAYIDHQIHAPASSGEGRVRVLIPPGATFHQTASILHEAGLIDNVTVFNLYARYRHLDRTVQAGAYELDRKLNMEQILLALQTAVPDEIFVTIPEGYTIQKTAKRLDAGGIIKGAEYLDLATKGSFGDQFPFLQGRPAGATLEGFLFPDTYLVATSSKTKANDLIVTQLKQFGTIWTDARQAQATQRKITILQAATIASMIEREAQYDEDRAQVSSVIYNRLARGMLLQIDATVLYAKGVWKATVTYDDRKIDSPYNTYLHPGLPPGPIANPGLKAIDAALNPAQTDYLYYLSDPHGHLHYARTLDEFNRLLRQYGLS